MHRLTYQFLFFFIDKFVSFLTYVNGGSLQTLTANESSFRQREKQTEKAEELRRNGNLTEARKALAAGAEISHDHVRGFIEVSSAVFRLCFKRRRFKILYDVVFMLDHTANYLSRIFIFFTDLPSKVCRLCGCSIRVRCPNSLPHEARLCRYCSYRRFRSSSVWMPNGKKNVNRTDLPCTQALNTWRMGLVGSKCTSLVCGPPST